MVTNKKRDKKSEFLSVRIPPALKAKVAKLAEEKERTLSWMIGKIIEHYFKNHDGKDL